MPDRKTTWKRLLQNAHAQGLPVQIFCPGSHPFTGKIVDLRPDGAYLHNERNNGHFHFDLNAALRDNMRLELA